VKSGDFDSATAHWTIATSDPTTAIKKIGNRIELMIRQKISRKGAKTQRKNPGLRTLRKFVEQEITEATENYITLFSLLPPVPIVFLLSPLRLRAFA
jgi:hypothetical protein